MSDIRARHESLPYPHYVHPLSDPAHLAIVARILGVASADPAAARVLEIGCGAGTNLLAMAARMPRSRFVGVDFSAPDLASAAAVATEAGLRNVEFIHADLTAWESHEQFDYVIAYGVFSWVPDAVKDALFRTIRACLAPQGVACVSYMTYPGCKPQEALRDLLLLRTRDLEDVADRIAAAHATLDLLDRAWRSMPAAPYAALLREEAARIRRKEPNFLLFDDLGPERDPCYLLQFAGWATEHGLRYLGDSDLPVMLLESLPAESARELAAMRLDPLQTEQMIDYVANRSFRCSLLVGPEAAACPGLHAEAVSMCAVSARLRPVERNRKGLLEGRFKIEEGSSVTLRSEPLVAFARALAARWGACVPFQDVLTDASLLASRTFTSAEISRLSEDLLSLYARRQIGLSMLAFAPPPDLPQRPVLTCLNAVLAAHRGLLVTALHQAIRLDMQERALCALLDGTRTAADLGATPAGRTLADRLVPTLRKLASLGCMAVGP